MKYKLIVVTPKGDIFQVQCDFFPQVQDCKAKLKKKYGKKCLFKKIKKPIDKTITHDYFFGEMRKIEL